MVVIVTVVVKMLGIRDGRYTLERIRPTRSVISDTLALRGIEVCEVALTRVVGSGRRERRGVVIVGLGRVEVRIGFVVYWRRFCTEAVSSGGGYMSG